MFGFIKRYFKEQSRRTAVINKNQIMIDLMNHKQALTLQKWMVENPHTNGDDIYEYIGSGILDNIK